MYLLSTGLIPLHRHMLVTMNLLPLPPGEGWGEGTSIKRLYYDSNFSVPSISQRHAARQFRRPFGAPHGHTRQPALGWRQQIKCEHPGTARQPQCRHWQGNKRARPSVNTMTF